MFLAKQGKKATIVEMREELGDAIGNWWYHLALVEVIDNEPNVSYNLQTRCMEVTLKGVHIEKDG